MAKPLAAMAASASPFFNLAVISPHLVLVPLCPADDLDTATAVDRCCGLLSHRTRHDNSPLNGFSHGAGVRAHDRRRGITRPAVDVVSEVVQTDRFHDRVVLLAGL